MNEDPKPMSLDAWLDQPRRSDTETVTVSVVPPSWLRRELTLLVLPTVIRVTRFLLARLTQFQSADRVDWQLRRDCEHMLVQQQKVQAVYRACRGRKVSK